MAKRKAKPATAGERSEMAFRNMKLCQVRCFGDTRARAEQIDLAIARAVKRERLRCAAIAKRGVDGENDANDVWVEILNGVTP